MLASSSPCQGCQVSATEREQRNYGASNRAVYSWSKRSVVNTKARLFKNRRALVSAASTEAPSTGFLQGKCRPESDAGSVQWQVSVKSVSHQFGFGEGFTFVVKAPMLRLARFLML